MVHILGVSVRAVESLGLPGLCPLFSRKKARTHLAPSTLPLCGAHLHLEHLDLVCVS